ncbi:MAG TPA: GLPGLI family protein [Moheibacter sp.]|nr:GLPGLI family protein [Moheibacter sp.]
MKTIFPIILIFIGLNLWAQDLISVTYEGYVKSTPPLERYKNNPQKLAEMERAFEEAAKIPSIHILTLNKNESSFVLEERIQNNQPSERGMSMVRFTACNDLYINLNNKFILNEHDLGQKKYVIKDSLKSLDWKITNEKKEILGLEVRKAAAVYDSITNVEVWYAPKISFKNGPSQYWGLPGLILEVNESNHYPNGVENQVRFIATSIDTQPKSAEIERFEKHKQITQEEYDEILSEMQKVYQEMHDDGVQKD